MCIDTHREKEKEDTFGIWPTERARVQHGVIYGTFNGFFLFSGRKKRKKVAAGRQGGEVMAGDDGGELEPGRGMAVAWLEVCRWS